MKYLWLAVLLAVCLSVSGKPKQGDDSVKPKQDPKTDDSYQYGFDEPDPSEDYTSFDNEDDDDEEIDNNDTEAPKALLKSKDSEKIVELHGSAEFPCEGVYLDQYVRIWKKNDQMLYQSGSSTTNQKNIKLTSKQSLRIDNITASDVANYTCEILISNDNQLRVTHTLLVPVAPQITSLLSERNQTEFRKGQTLKLTCLATGVPKPTITWHRDNERLELSGETLTIDNIKANQAGAYRCLADSTSGAPAHQAIYIAVESRPTVVIDKYQVSTDHNMDVELKCMVRGFPEPITVWQKDGTNVVNGGGYVLTRPDRHTYILVIKEVQEHHFGRYSCVAKNTEGKDNRTVAVQKEPVISLVKTDKHDSEILISFKVESRSPIEEHELQYRKKGATEWVTVYPEVTDPFQKHMYRVQYTLDNLEPVLYQARVRSRNSHGWSEYSDVKEFGTAKHHNKHKKHQKEKEVKEQQPETPAQPPAQQESTHKETLLGASQTGASSTVCSSVILTSIALLTLLCCSK